jgi:transcriptional regulator with XRE-family HTH domain
LPFCRVTLKAKKPLSDQYPKSLSSVGDHLRKKRLDLGLLQRQVALLLGTTECSVTYWETNRTTPTLNHLPAIVTFLGYCPYDPAWSPGETLTMARQYRGITQEALARLVGVDPGTLARWERNERRPLKLCRKRLDEVLLA